MNANLPSGTITFFFTDIQGSTPLWEREPEKMTVAIERHHALLRSAIESNGGQVFKIIGDAFQAAFAIPAQAVAAALAAQRSLAAEAWPTSLPIRVRMGLHVGQAETQANDYAVSHTLNRVARIMSAGHGGQVLLSVEVVDLTRGYLPAEVTLRDMGKHRMKGMTHPEYLYQLLAPDLHADFPPLQTFDALPNNLPIQLTSFVGRENVVAEIKALLNSSRLVTLTGSGGTGKTRISIQVGTQLLTDFQHGVWMIELAPLSNESQITPAIAQAFGLRELPFNPLKNVLSDYLRDKKLLLILDNCEHLIAACASIADELLHQCAGLRILASSREALGIAGEAAYRIPSLADSESTQLFVDRARAANPAFAVTDSVAASIAKICHRLDGIPLAIELAAARTKLLSVDQIAARLDDLFRLLVGGSRTALPRQRTLRALIDWSYDLLSEEEKNLLRIASVFVGGWTLEALEAVSDEPNAIEYLDGLVSKSLVVTEERGGEMRYSLLETIRQYAGERLFETKQAAAVRDRHFAYFKAFSMKIEEWFTAKLPYLSWLARIQDEVENLRAALEWGLDTNVEEVIELSANYCLGNAATEVGSGGYALTAVAIERFKALPPTDAQATKQRQSQLAKAYFAQGTIALFVGNVSDSHRDFREGIAVARAAGDRRMLGYCLTMLSASTVFLYTPGADEAAEEGYRIFRDEADELAGLSWSLMNKSRIAQNNGDAAGMNMYQAQLKELIQQLPVSLLAGHFYFLSAMREKAHANYSAAKAYLEDSLLVFKQLRNKTFVLSVQTEFGHIARYTGRLDEANDIYRKALVDWQDSGNRGAVANIFECFALLAAVAEEPRRAAILLGSAEALREKAQSPMTDLERVEYDRCVAQLRSLLPGTEFGALWGEGRAKPLQQAIEFALENVGHSE